MKTTLEILCTTFGWQGGTLHEAMRHFQAAPMSTKDKACNALMRALDARELADVETARDFFHARLGQ